MKSIPRIQIFKEDELLTELPLPPMPVGFTEQHFILREKLIRASVFLAAQKTTSVLNTKTNVEFFIVMPSIANT